MQKTVVVLLRLGAKCRLGAFYAVRVRGFHADFQELLPKFSGKTSDLVSVCCCETPASQETRRPFQQRPRQGGPLQGTQDAIDRCIHQRILRYCLVSRKSAPNAHSAPIPHKQRTRTLYPVRICLLQRFLHASPALIGKTRLSVGCLVIRRRRRRG